MCCQKTGEDVCLPAECHTSVLITVVAVFSQLVADGQCSASVVNKKLCSFKSSVEINVPYIFYNVHLFTVPLRLNTIDKNEFRTLWRKQICVYFLQHNLMELCGTRWP